MHTEDVANSDEIPRPAPPPPRTYRGIVYVNAYAVTRHYGGPEEGGWWYNRGEPLASVPIPAEITDRHDRDGGENDYTYCTGCYSDEGERTICSNREVVPDENAKEAMIAYLKGAFADVVEGNIYSVLGGTALEIRIEDEQAYAWPEARPHYE